MKKIAVIGSNMVDLVTSMERMPKPGETLEAPRFAMGFGGKGSNQAIAAARLGAEVMIVTRVGDDMFGPNTLENYRKNGIDGRHAKIVSGLSSGVAPIFVDPQGQNSIFIIKGANNALLPVDIDAAWSDIEQCGLIVMQLEIPLESVYHVIDRGTEAGIPVLLNPAPAIAGMDMEKISRLAVLVPNETELEILTGMPVGSVEEIEAAARHLVATGVKTLIVTMGEKGAMLVTGQQCIVVDCPKVKARDTTGAGDAFIGCFCRYYMEGQDILKAMRQAVLYASMSTLKAGTQSSFATVEEFAAFTAGQ